MREKCAKIGWCQWTQTIQVILQKGNLEKVSSFPESARYIMLFVPSFSFAFANFDHGCALYRTMTVCCPF